MTFRPVCYRPLFTVSPYTRLCLGLLARHRLPDLAERGVDVGQQPRGLGGEDGPGGPPGPLHADAGGVRHFAESGRADSLGGRVLEAGLVLAQALGVAPPPEPSAPGTLPAGEGGPALDAGVAPPDGGGGGGPGQALQPAAAAEEAAGEHFPPPPQPAAGAAFLEHPARPHAAAAGGQGPGDAEGAAEPQRPGHDWIWQRGRWYCAMCLVYNSAAAKPGPAACPGRSERISAILLNSDSGHSFWNLWIEGSELPMVFCRKCGAWAVSKPEKLAKVCMPPTKAGRAARRRVSCGKHPQCNRLDLVEAALPLNDLIAEQQADHLSRLQSELLRDAPLRVFTWLASSVWGSRLFVGLRQ